MNNEIPQVQNLRDLAAAVAEKHQIDPRLMQAIITVESAFNPWAMRYEPNWQYLKNTADFAKRNCITEKTEWVLQSSSFGLMQLMGAVARDFGYVGTLTCLLDPAVNLEFGALKLKSLLNKYPLVDDVISAYNAGIPKKDPVLFRYINQDYVEKVKALL